MCICSASSLLQPLSGEIYCSASAIGSSMHFSTLYFIDTRLEWVSPCACPDTCSSGISSVRLLPRLCPAIPGVRLANTAVMRTFDKVIGFPPKCPILYSLLFSVYPQSVESWVASPPLLPASLRAMKHVLPHPKHGQGGPPWISVHLRLTALPLIGLGLGSFSCDPALMTHLLLTHQASNILVQISVAGHLPHYPVAPYSCLQMKGLVLAAYMLLALSGSVSGNQKIASDRLG